jgi:hypothetical protein
VRLASGLVTLQLGPAQSTNTLPPNVAEQVVPSGMMASALSAFGVS